MNIIALILLSIAFAVTLKNKKWTSVEGEENVEKKNSYIIPYFVCVYDGGFGPGSSTFSILYYMGKSHSYLRAVQLTRVLILGSCFGAFLVFYYTGFIQWNYAIALAIGSTIGSQIGLLALPRIPLRVAKILLMSITVLLIGQVVYKLTV